MARIITITLNGGIRGIVYGIIIASATIIVIIVVVAMRSLRPRQPEPTLNNTAPAKAESGAAETTLVDMNTPQPQVSPEQLEESRNLLYRVISDLGTSIQQLVGVAATYDAGLARHEDRLKQTAQKNELRTVYEEILQELHEMRQANARYKAELADTQEQLREREAEVASLQLDMNTDHLTRILNRRGLESRLQEEMARAKRYGNPFSVAMFDIDRFKEVNDEHGHAAGDKVLRLVAHTLDELKRTNDAAGRYGGEEFMLLLPAATAEQATAVAERARRQMERFVTRFNDSRIRVTMSGGITQYDPENDTLETLVHRVDKALYNAKENGRNCMAVVEV